MVTLEYPRPEAVLPPSNCEPSGNRSGQKLGSGENYGSERAEIPEEEYGNEESSSEPNRPSEKRNLVIRWRPILTPSTPSGMQLLTLTYLN